MLNSLSTIHYDLWGPSPHSDINGFRWFLICVDNNSRYTLLYLLKLKTEVAKILKNFCYLVNRKFGVDIQRYFTNNAKDFC